jgi:hypothetical protein
VIGADDRTRYDAVMNARLLCLALSITVGCGNDDRGGDPGGHPDGIGNRCDEDADCETHECYIGPGGGYCTTECSDEGSESQCPLDTVCKPIQGGARRCLLICGSETACDEILDECFDEYCPSGSSCVSVGNTSRHACEPDPS